MAARIRLSPAEREAVARFVIAAARMFIRMGWGWAALTTLGVLGAGWAAWTFPTWWNWFLDWLEE